MSTPEDHVNSDQPAPATPESALCSVVRFDRGDIAVLSVTGDLDAFTAPALQHAVVQAVASAPRALIADLTGVDYLGSAGMSVLIDAHEQMIHSGGFAIVAEGRATSRPLHIVGLTNVIPTCPTLNDAITLFDA
ncbi:STAS domain-containing protein [Mycobacterium sp. 236(2023)]|uniref:STAS domain-containing protein n=1 Tax=Mycobacterium sp. 236(2023) TaxID=3038163 RepID=UPI002414E95A|nr:STAS domain-containing protein [Mycobacterium sp. 236(2023)]MDG4667001.1 STAS domain-containing protein [Mycobacterium sp. 236(2023)]